MFLVSLYWIMLPLVAVLTVFGHCIAFQGGDADIYPSAIAALKELDLQNELDLQYGSLQRADSVCYDELGCFDKNRTFRHLKQLPEPPEAVDTKFLLYTRKNPTEPQFLDYKKPDTILKSHLNPDRPLKLISHGFGEKNNLTWIWNMKTAFLKKEDVNVVAIDWSLGARLPNYIQATVNTEIVGAQAAVLYYFIKDNFKIMEKDLHVIGFSLGAHVAGFVGKRMQELRGTRPGRITGLDPASPLFEDYGGEVHLYQDDADFVDVIHSNADLLLYGGVGISKPIGHVDYYPNGGKRQPGCGSTIKGAIVDMFKGMRERVCNHERAVLLFTDSILDDDSCQFTAYRCGNYSEFESGQCLTCEDSCGRMGYHTVGTGVYYLKTKAERPYCADIAKLTVKFPTNIKRSYGVIILTVEGGNGEKENITITGKEDRLNPGGEKTFSIVVSDVFTPLRSVKALYKRYNGWFTKGTETFGLSSLTIIDTKTNYIFKSCGDVVLKDREYYELEETSDGC